MKVKKNNISPLTGKNTEVILELEKYPITEVYQTYSSNDFKHPLTFDQEIRYCYDTNHMFLGNLLPQEFLYDAANYNTLSSSSEGSRIALDNFYSFISKQLNGNYGAFIDIGANDTLLLKKFKKFGASLIGIDPNIQSDDEDIICVKDYFENVKNLSAYENKRVFLCSHTLEHIYDPQVFMGLLKEEAKEDDLFFFQFPSLNLLLRDLRFDQLHHQHIHYFSVESFKYLIESNGFELLSYNLDADHYGTLQASFRKKTSVGSIPIRDFIKINDFNKKYNLFKEIMNVADLRIKQLENNFYCYGAALMLPILAYYINSLQGAIKILDENEEKKGLSYVNFDIEIVSPKTITYDESNFVITAIATKLATRNILKKLSDLRAMNIILPFNTL